MDRLVRNSNRIITPLSGKPFRENDPEGYIDRLHHFASGMGFTPEHLTSGANPAFTGKGVNVTWYDDPQSRIGEIEEIGTEYGFDEGHIPWGEVLASQVAIEGVRVANGLDAEDAVYAHKELRHRGRMSVGRTLYSEPKESSPFTHRYMVASKEANLPISRENPGEGKILPITAGGAYKSIEELHSKATHNIDDVASQFRERNRSRSVNPRGLDIVRHVLANPSDKNMTETLRNNPNNLSPQFLKVRTAEANSNYPKFDQIDLKTGTWAKIDPDGYFPT